MISHAHQQEEISIRSEAQSKAESQAEQTLLKLCLEGKDKAVMAELMCLYESRVVSN
jgi:hypothetical protein